MTLTDVINNWHDLHREKKIRALQRVLDYVKFEDEDDDDLLLCNVLGAAAKLEDDDYFGTEGLNV